MPAPEIEALKATANCTAMKPPAEMPDTVVLPSSTRPHGAGGAASTSEAAAAIKTATLNIQVTV